MAIGFWSELKRRWKQAVIFLGVVIVFTVVLSILQPFEYETKTKLLIIHRASASYDPFLSAKAAERISISLSEVIYTSSFISKVQNSDYNFPSGFFQEDPHVVRKDWKDRVKANPLVQTGFLEIQTYHEDAAVSEKLASAIAEVLVEQGSEYHGAGDVVSIQVIDAPVTSERPVRPHIALNVLAALILGVVVFIIFVLLKFKGDINTTPIMMNALMPVARTPINASSGANVSSGLGKTQAQETKKQPVVGVTDARERRQNQSMENVLAPKVSQPARNQYPSGQAQQGTKVLIDLE